MKQTPAKLLLTLALFLPLAAHAQFASTGARFSDLVGGFINLMNAAIPLLIGFAIIFFFIGLIRYIYRAGDAKGRAAGRDNIIWGLVAMFVLFSIWGILNFLQAAFLPTYTLTNPPSYTAPPSFTKPSPGFVPDTPFQYQFPTTPAQQVQGGVAPM